ncbi:hypothetical protein CsSME_00014978 [Camellia sinensis var. sinensis]
MAESMDYYYNYSQTERIVLLIDLYPLLHLQNPNPYLSTILTASQTLLLFPSLSSSLFAFKLFFSSLSPLLSSSSLHRLLHIPSTTHLSFNRPSQTLDSLSKTLNSLSNSPISTEFAISPPRASHVAGSLLHLVHGYAWDAQSENLSAFEFSELELEEAYFARRFSKSKKLKFLKCWMKQMKKSACGCLTVPDRSKSCQHIEREIDERLTGTDQERGIFFSFLFRNFGSLFQ